jgi:DNA repair protein RecN (Recombination protein N)
MIKELRIRDFAIIDELDITFKEGLIIFTGETGAGKSIIIDAVDTLLGGRADSNFIRVGSDFASVEGVFNIPDNCKEAIYQILEKEEFLDSSDKLTLTREIRLNGRNIARVNGFSANASILRQLGEYLVDVHGQSEHLSLLRVNQHIELLDRFASSDPKSKLPDQLKQYQRIYQRLETVEKELKKLRESESEAARQTDMLNFQINEIETAHLQLDEEERLIEERNRLANSEDLARYIQSALQALDESALESPAAIDLVGQATEFITDLARLDNSQLYLVEQIQIIFESLSELSRNLRAYSEGVEFNPKRLDQVEERLALIQSLNRKYGNSIGEVLNYLEEAKNRLENITHTTENIQNLETEKEDLRQQLGTIGLMISDSRKEAAKELEAQIESELDTLHMSGACFRVNFTLKETPDGILLPDGKIVAYYFNGLEQIEFLIAPNPGEGFKPLIKIASGGETSRLMLALKNVLAHADHIPALIFDEIDQGIGGRVGAIVGQKLKQLSNEHQVVCITHLPQLAAYGNQHFHVEKQVDQGRTTTQIKELIEQDRIMELANMLGEISEGTLRSAHELLQSVEKHSKSN